MVSVTKYAGTVEQIKDDRFQTMDWSNIGDAVGSTDLFTSSVYSNNFIPAQLYAHDFGFNLPEQADIKEVLVEVRVRGETVKVNVPRAYFYYDGMIGHSTVSYSSNIFNSQPDGLISSAWNNVSYSMDWSDVVLYKCNRERVNSSLFGVILQFDSSTVNGSVHIEWVRVTVTYNKPEFALEMTGKVTDRDFMAQYNTTVDVNYSFNVTMRVHNTQYITSNTKTVQIDIPFGLHIREYSTSSNCTFNPNNKTLTCNFKDGRSPWVTFKLFGRTAGLKKLTIGSDEIGYLSKYVYILKTSELGADEEVNITSSNIRRWSESCFHFAVKSYNDDGIAGYDVFLDGKTNKTNKLIEWKLDKTLSDPRVSIRYSNEEYIEFNVPKGEIVDIFFTGCFYPVTTGDNYLVFKSDDTGDEYTYEYTSLEPYEYEITLLSKDILFDEHRIVSTIETGSYNLPCRTSEYDVNSIVGKSTLQVKKYEDIDYIGCVALEQTHFDPKSTYKDTLLNTSYKNKRYMGKKGASDETVTLNVRLHPQDVTTMQGLVDMDKPVPINANHKCFEGDALNFRGWYELYGITSEKTNPHWYKCELNVKCITHNLNTRFLINKGSRVSDYFLPELMSNVVDYGDDISDFFFITTSGGYSYFSSLDDYHMRNILSLPTGKRFILRSKDKLSIKSQVNINWYSSRNTNNQYNNLSRVFRLIDSETGNAVFEYEYYDVDFSRTNEYNARVIARVLYKGGYKTVLNRALALNNDSEYDGNNASDIDVYGSELIFKIVNDKLSIQDCGWSGKELIVDDIGLVNGQYYLDVEFKNNNSAGADINNWIDLQVQELDLSAQYSQYYSDLLVSPFPVPDKMIVFMRESEDGTIFYLEDDGTESSYNISPYYQYHCGVNLESKDGVSIFNLDNNYTVVYITNGLIKLGVNRLNGRMYLYKYDKYSKQYILTNRFQLTKYNDMNINSYSDDKIELQISDTILTVWRGRPYVHIAHPTEDILFDSVFTKIYSEGVGDDISEYPHLWSLVDYTNLLPECVGSERNIDENCVKLDTFDVSTSDNKVSIDMLENNGLAEPSVFASDCMISGCSCKYIVDGEIVDPVVYNKDVYSHKLEYQFLTEGMHTVKAVYYKGSEYYFSDAVTIIITDNTYKITPLFGSSMYFMQEDFKCRLTHSGEPVKGATITFYANGLSYPKLTDSDGVATLNNRLPAKAEINNQSQAESIGEYTIYMSYSKGGEIVASAEKSTRIDKGYVSVSLDKTIVNKGSYILVTFKNNLDPEDDDISSGEIYLKNKSVVLSINGRDYPRITDNTGTCRLNINLLKGNYDLRVVFGGDYQYNGTVKNFELKVVE